jgi:hypothetical protein
MATLITDNFNSYNNGTLLNQGIWTANSGTGVFNIQSGMAIEGKAISTIGITTDSIIATKTFPVTGTARQTFYVYPTSTVPYFDVQFCTGSQYPSQSNTPAIIQFYQGFINYYTGAIKKPFATYVINKWYCVEIEWRTSDNTQRLRVNQGAWTIWDTVYNGGTLGNINSLFLEANGEFYADYFAEWPYTAGNFSQFS